MQHKRLITIAIAPMIIAPVMIAIALARKTDAQSPGSRLKTIFTGDNKCLDIINDGQITNCKWPTAATSQVNPRASSDILPKPLF